MKLNEININYTISIGIAEIDNSIQNHQACIEGPDAALYRSKETDRNKTTLYPKQSK